MALIVLALLALLPLAPAGAITSTTITVDGNMGDWATVLSDGDNVLLDTIRPRDPDAPGQGDRDIETLAATWDTAHLYLYWQRVAGGSRALTVFAYVDCDGDDLLESTDRVVIMGFGNGGAYQGNPNSSNVVLYTPFNPAGDLMFGDGWDPPGNAAPNANRVPGASFLGAGESSGLRFEARVSWATLGVSAGSPVGIHFAAGNGAQAPLQLEDNAGAIGNLRLAQWGVSVEPDRSAGGAAGTDVVFTHTVTNTGNVSGVFDLSAISQSGWTTRITRGGSPISAVTLQRGESTTITVTVSIPGGAANGARDTVAVAAVSRAKPDVSDTASDEITVGAVVVEPDRAVATTAGSTVRLAHTVTNTTSQTRTFDLSALSSLGWPATLEDLAGQPVSSLTLGPGASAGVVAVLSVPGGATVGQQDVLRVVATDRADPQVSGEAHDTVAVSEAILLAPDRSSYGGPGWIVSYQHTVTNNLSQARTVTLAAVSSQGWTVRLYAADGVTPISSVTVGPNGGTVDFIARVSIPAGAAPGTTDVTMITGSAAPYSDSVIDTTGVSRLVTYGDAAFTSPRSQFTTGETVYARGMALNGVSSVVFRWLDPDMNVVRTSPSVPVSPVTLTAPDSYALPANASVGAWTVVLYNAATMTEIARAPFTVGYDAEITSLSAGDAPSVGDYVAVTSSVVNRSGVAISDSSITYVIWWDSDGNGALNSGDLYIDVSGTSHAWDGVTNPVTHVTSGVDVAAGSSWSEAAPWTMSNAGFPNQGTYRVTATWRSSTFQLIDVATTDFYSIPTLGWALFATFVAGAAWFLWKRRSSLRPSGVAS